MKVLFIDGISERTGLVNLGLGFLAQHIRKLHFVKIMALAFHNPEDIVTIAGKFDIVGFSCLTGQYVKCLNVAKLVKKKYPNKLIIFGNIHPTAMPLATMDNPEIDFVCLGEGEISFLTLLNHLERGSDDFSRVPGMVYRDKNGNIQQTKPKFIDDLDTIGMPAWDLLERDKRSKKGNMITSRGCPFTCTYCYNSVMRRKFEFKYRRRSVESVVEECSYLKAEGLTYIAFSDDLFLINEQWLDEFAELFAKCVNNMAFGIAARPEMVLRRQNSLRQLKRVGLRDIWIGIESGNERIRREILNRRMSNRSIITAFRTIKTLGVSSKSYNIVGIPTEGPREVLDTFVINLKARPNYTSHYTLMPYPGTEIWNIAEKQNLFVRKDLLAFSDAANVQSNPFSICEGPLNTGKLNTYQIVAIRHLWRVVFHLGRFYRIDHRIHHLLLFLKWSAKGFLKKVDMLFSSRS